MGFLAGIMIGSLTGFTSGISKGLSDGILAGLPIALFSGLLFGLGMGSFAVLMRQRFVRAESGFTEEQLLHDGPANHFLNGEGVGGWLYLTNRHLVFRSHPLNFQPHELSLGLVQISDAQASRTAKIIPNGLRITMSSGHNEVFVVNAHKVWRDKILQAKARPA